MASRVISRMTDSVNLEVRSLRNLGLWFESIAGRTELFCAEGVIKKAYHGEISLDSGTGSTVHTGSVPCYSKDIFAPASLPGRLASARTRCGITSASNCCRLPGAQP